MSSVASSSLCDRQEKLYEREAVLGRDTTSVFPSETAKEGFASQDAKDMVGTSKFVTEAQASVLADWMSVPSELPLFW